VAEHGKPRDRRIGERIAIEPIEVAWLLASTRSSGLLRRRTSEAVEEPGRVVDISVTGAGIEGPDHPDLVPRSIASVTFEGGVSVVRIRRKVATTRPGVAFYGVELEELDERLREAFYSALGRGRPGENSWRRSW
jgi:hypothetical protein